jgi:hypothetical protein
MTKTRSTRRRTILLALLAAYLLGYLGLRLTGTEVWERDGRPYVIFPAGAAPLYYLYRPMSYLDQALTGTGSHIGPHQ